MVDQLESLFKNLACEDCCAASCFPHRELAALFHLQFVLKACYCSAASFLTLPPSLQTHAPVSAVLRSVTNICHVLALSSSLQEEECLQRSSLFWIYLDPYLHTSVREEAEARIAC